MDSIFSCFKFRRRRILEAEGTGMESHRSSFIKSLEENREEIYIRFRGKCSFKYFYELVEKTSNSTLPRGHRNII